MKKTKTYSEEEIIDNRCVGICIGLAAALFFYGCYSFGGCLLNMDDRIDNLQYSLELTDSTAMRNYHRLEKIKPECFKED